MFVWNFIHDSPTIAFSPGKIFPLIFLLIAENPGNAKKPRNNVINIYWKRILYLWQKCKNFKQYSET